MSMQQDSSASTATLPAGNPYQDPRKTLDWSRSDVEPGACNRTQEAGCSA